MFLGKLSGVSACEFLALLIADRLTQIGKHLSRSLIVCGTSSLDKLRRAAGLDRRLTVRELIEKAFGHIPRFKSKDELIDDEFQKFLLDQKPEQADRIAQMRYYFEAYIKDANVRRIIDDGRVADLNVNPIFGMKDLKAVPKEWVRRIPEYIKDYVSLNPFLP